MMIDKRFQNLANSIQSTRDIFLNGFGRIVDKEDKFSENNFRTEIDIEVEKTVIKNIKDKFPEYNISAEESGLHDKGSEYTFFIDPLDGTFNYFYGIPIFTLSIGLVKNNDCVFGVIYNPLTNSVYVAESGQGAYKNGEQIKVGNEESIRNSIVSYNCNYEIGRTSRPYEIFQRLHKLSVKRELTLWSVAFEFCLLAEGKIQGIINENSEIYDFIAGKLIAKEAGAITSDFDGKKEESDLNRKFVISCNDSIQKELVNIL